MKNILLTNAGTTGANLLVQTTLRAKTLGRSLEGHFTFDEIPDRCCELRHHRVVLRTQARSASARRAVALAECARLQGSFASMQRALIHHRGPFDDDSLLRLAHDSEEWRATAEKQELNLLPISAPVTDIVFPEMPETVTA